ncbi:MAG: efflux RND transporter permease subunit, partial [Muribaculaceae bacterium]|nr:efflux RND transporter permease subunit [Muribaculaceae bacterium]
PMTLRSYGITVDDIEEALKGFVGRTEIIGELTKETDDGTLERKALYLEMDRFDRPLELMPIKNVGGSMVYMGDLSSCEYRDRLPDSYYRLNGLSTIYLNIYVDSDAPKIRLSHELRKRVSELKGKLKRGVNIQLSMDTSKKQETDLHKLVRRSLMSLLILLIFIRLIRRRWSYLLLISSTLAANILIAVMIYWIADIRLHTVAIAGITVSLGIIIDSAIVMTDHYLLHRDRNAFFALLAALLTTIGALVIVFFLPEHLRNDLYDFAWIVIINLTVSLIVALLFVPTLAEKLGLADNKPTEIRHTHFTHFAVRLISLYGDFIRFTRKRRWIYVILTILLFGIMIYALRDNNPDRRREEPEKRLNIRGRMPVGGSMHELNDKMMQVERFLTQFPEIEKFETDIRQWGGQITVEFNDSVRNSGFPYTLENRVIGKLITLGGAEWSTYGVSEQGFSNSLNLSYRTHRIEIAGYNYDRLYRYAEKMVDRLGDNPRVQDIVIEIPGHENQEDELYMVYDRERVALDGFSVSSAHASLSELLADREVGRYRDRFIDSDIRLRSRRSDNFDLWHLQNSYIDVNGNPARLSNYMEISRRQAKNSIPRRNQEYVLRIAFNVLGSWTYSDRLIKEATDEFNSIFPIGYRCIDTNYMWYENDGVQYWLLLLVAVIIYFVCAVLFESLTLPLSVISLIPVSLTGTLLAFRLTGIPLGNGGFASMVLLAGIVVNAGIYQIYEYKSLLRKKRLDEDNVSIYLSAFRNKAVPVFLTILSTMLGLSPFLFERTGEEDFWYSFTIGTMGGLIFSLIAYVLVMPILLRLKPEIQQVALY